MEKKYKLKGEKDVVASVDGIENGEHIIDLLQKYEMLYNNIIDNNNIILSVFEEKKKGGEDDTLYALGLVCEKACQLEEKAKNLFDIGMRAKENLAHLDKDNEKDFKLLLGEMIMLEEESRKLLVSIF